MTKNQFDGFNYKDHVIYCDICGCPTPFADATLLDVYTGRGGLLVCKRDKDDIDYGLVPYKINTESVIKEASINHYATNPDNIPNLHDPFDYALYDPMSYDPNGVLNVVWEAIDQVTWEDWNSAWET
jgi:hypothetical protein